jgi:hypothetical protein
MFLGSRAQPVPEAHNFTAIYEPIFMRSFQHLTTLQASTACYGYSFSSFLTLQEVDGSLRTVEPVRRFF